MDALFQDLHAAARTLRRRPLFVLVAGLSLAVGIGANTAIFSVANALVLRPLPGIDGQEQVVDLGRAHARYGGHDSFTWPDFRDIREGVSALEDAAAVRMIPLSLSREEAGEMVAASFVPARRAVEVEPARALRQG